MSLETCLDALDSLKKRCVTLQDSKWIPDDLIEILNLLPRRAKEQDFRDCVFIFDCIRVARSLFEAEDWFPTAPQVEQMLKVKSVFN